jgi:lipopolysaccharide exporter
MLAKKVATGALWLVGARLATKALDLVSLLIVARLLVPADFGLFALAATVLLVLNAVTDLSLLYAIVQMREPPDAVYDTAFTLSAARGLVLCGALVSVAWPFAELYGDPRLASIILALAAVPLLRGLASPRLAFLQRQMEFRPSFYLEAAGKAAAFVASITAAVLTRNYWALVAGMIAAPIISTLLSYRLAPYRPTFALSDWKPIFAFSGWLSLSNVVNTLNWQADRLFIGGQLGTAALGHYTVGSELATLPTNAPIMPIMQALYAGFAKLSDDLERLRTAYLASQCAVMAIAMPIAITVSVFAYTIVFVAIGQEWTTSAFVIQVIAPISALQMLTGPAQSISMVRGRTDAILRRDLAALGLRLPLILFGIYLAGLEGAVWARIVPIRIGLNLMLMKSMLDLSVFRQLLAPWRSYLSGLALAVMLVTVGSHLDLLAATDIWVLPQLICVAAAGFALYAVVHLGLWSITQPANSAERKLLDIWSHAIGQPRRV